jgi:hypothetical protein
LARLFAVLGFMSQRLAKHSLLKRDRLNAKHRPW